VTRMFFGNVGNVFSGGASRPRCQYVSVLGRLSVSREGGRSIADESGYRVDRWGFVGLRQWRRNLHKVSPPHPLFQHWYGLPGLPLASKLRPFAVGFLVPRDAVVLRPGLPALCLLEGLGTGFAAG
jgi:hypothetical protein